MVGYLEDWLQVGCNVVITLHENKPWEFGHGKGRGPTTPGLGVLVINRLHPLG